ncbi:BRE1 E3 ubiquitin ligase-domain-containing protein [Amylocarpus encephaloides]|uniref:E3 ubiquitin protein ligase n=1 Tax=Amylocarpus encephaloides TaxID=45428 RepID=A0A9P7YJX0_9HELO|nr:BRE1 E3 ubiquitin ligase-domain-containing protein [Amylocarpus encephaloides]
MEDRKRSAGDELAPPTKRQAVNGKSSADSDMPWSSDLEKYQKDAIYRQMLEYKREKTTLESQLRDVQKRSVDHDDHLRVIHAWWTQLLDEVKLLVEDEIPSSDDIDSSFPTELQFKGSEDFQTHLASRAKEIKSKLQAIFSNLASTRNQPSSDVRELQGKLTKLLSTQKELALKVDRLRTEKDELGERLETASLRYIKAEKRLDRAKSSAVAKLEQQAIANSSGSGIGATENGDTEMTNGISEDNKASQTAYDEAKSVVVVQKQQLETIAAENKSLTEQLTAATTRLSNLTEDDYARTELFKQFRIQHEDVIRRINHLEATNIQLREEAEKYQAERTAYRTQIENESEIITGELESQLARVEADLTRIRSTRDELIADLSMRKSSQEQNRTSGDHLKELVCAKDSRIAALELEVERLRTQMDEQSCQSTERPEIDSLDLEQLRQKYEALAQEFESINKEMPALQGAYKRVQALSTKKVMDFTVLEERVSILQAEKSKADQKYFAARKDMDTRIFEVKSLRAQNAKSSEIITQLKDVETSNRTLVSNLEKQLSDMRQSNTAITSENKKMDATSREATSKTDSLKNQVVELTNLLKYKDNANSSTKQRLHTLETDLEQIRVRYEHVQKDRDSWKTKSLNNQSGEEEMLRTLALCTICRKDFKNTALKTCGHVFCNNCVDDRIANRMRKCPNCAKAFDKMDVMTVHM